MPSTPSESDSDRSVSFTLRRSGLPAHNCLFVDDLEQNILAAQTLGLATIHFSGVDNLKNRLAALGFRVN